MEIDTAAGIGRPLRVMALMEATAITGPAKNLFAFARCAHEPGNVFPAGVELTLATFQRGPEENDFIRGARRAGLPVDVIHEQKAFQLSIRADLRNAIEKRRPDIIQTHNIKSHFLVRLLGLSRRFPWIAFHHGYVATDAKVHAYNQLNRWSLRSAHRLVAVCGPFSEQLQKTGLDKNRITVRHNMIRPYERPSREETDQLRRRIGVRPDECMILSVGRLSREKGHLDLVEAIGALVHLPHVPPFRVVIAGEGPDRTLIERRSAELQITGVVELAGYHSDLRPWYGAADILVLPSHSEGSPNVLLEAMAAGLPTVATAVGGIPEIAAHEENALLVPKSDPMQMALAIARLLKDADLRRLFGSRGPAVTDRFTPQVYCEAVLALYQDLLQTTARNNAHSMRNS